MIDWKNDVKKRCKSANVKNIEYKIPDIISLATSASLNAKINEAKGEIPSITDLAATDALNAKINGVKSQISSIILT